MATDEAANFVLDRGRMVYAELQASKAKVERLCAPIKMQDIRLVAGEGALPAWAVLDAVNAILRQRSK